MRIGLIADTHGYVDESILAALAGCDQIVHAGDVGSGVLGPLESLAPLVAVRGNVDAGGEGAELPEEAWFEAEGRRVAVVHRLSDAPPPETWDVLMFGHSHRQHAAAEDGRLRLNPGAAGRRGFHHRRSLLVVDLLQGEPASWQFTDLGPRVAARRAVPVGSPER
jgi:putative phosphoesterase